VRQFITVDNDETAKGGQNTPDIEFLRSLIKPSRNSQNRIVTREDLLARIYTLPAKFGRVFRVGISENPVNPLSLMMYVISLDKDGNLADSPDTLKDNLSEYLNEFRLISDAIDICDVSVINYGIRYEVLTRKETNKTSVLQQINRELTAALRLKYFQVDQPIVIDDITNIIINATGVISLTSLSIFSRINVIENRTYSSFSFAFPESEKNGILRGTPGSIFELKFPDHDIIGYAI
jgi:hypothetical protein